MNKIAVGDSDALIAMVDEGDLNHKKAIEMAKKLATHNIKVIFPNTVIVETVTALIRAKSLPDKAHLVNQQYHAGVFDIYYVDEETQKEASEIFGSTKSKQNTFFDAIVVATAKSLGTKAIFSFDKWYPKLGLKLGI